MELGLDLHAFNCVIVVDVLDFMTEDEGQLILALNFLQQPPTDENMPARYGECIDQTGIGKQVKVKVDSALRMRGHS